MKTLIAIPCIDAVNVLFMKSLLTMQLEGEVEFSLAIGSLIYDARNQLAYKAVGLLFRERRAAGEGGVGLFSGVMCHENVPFW